MPFQGIYLQKRLTYKGYMARLTSPWRRSLSSDDFEKYPVWEWDDENIGHQGALAAYC